MATTQQFNGLLTERSVGFFFARAALQDQTSPEHLQAIYTKAQELYDQASTARGSFVPVVTYIDRSEKMDGSALRMSISRERDGGLVQEAFVDLDVIANPEGWGCILILAPAMHGEQPIAA